MRVLVTGASGLVGTALCKALRVRGDEVVRLQRNEVPVDKKTSEAHETPETPAPPDTPDVVRWNPITGAVDVTRLEGMDAVVNLAGAGIADSRWTPARKTILRDSRVVGTGHLAKILAELKTKPAVFISASAVGYYGNRGDEVLTEQSSPGDDFLAQTAIDWENATSPAQQAGIRTLCARFGVILSKDGGALAKMITPFRYALGGRVGNGLQYWPCVGLHDTVRALCFLIDHTDDPELIGPVNIVGPAPETNLGFTLALGDVLSRPTVLPLPAFAVKLLLGEMGDALLLSSTRVLPRKLEAAGFKFYDGNVEAMLKRAIDGDG